MRLKIIYSFIAREDGVTAIEYALLGALIVAVIVGAIALVGAKTSALWQGIADCVAKATTGAGSCP